MQNYDCFGVMLDCSRNAVMKPEEIKKFGALIKKMGYDSIMLYTEDTMEVENEPLFGYMRGAYTVDEIKDVDAYLKSIGVELMPCIQTLAHFTNLVRLPEYKKLVDINDVLMIDEPRTYELIDNIFATLAKAFTSRVVNIGMDEAHGVGLGKYFDKHGLVDRTELLLRHLNKVCKIAKKYGFKPVMWSDMFFRLATHGEYVADGVEFSDDVKKLIPDNISFAYWDYYRTEKSEYDKMIEAHLKLGREVWFAGGAWCWSGFGPKNKYSLHTMIPAMQSVKEHGIKKVFITMWGDNGKECSFYSMLPSLYKIAKTAEGVFDENEIKAGFEKLFDVSYDEFMLVDLPQLRSINDEGKRCETICKSLTYTDPFTGKFDRALRKIGKIDYKLFAELLSAQAEKQAKNGVEFAYVFDYLAKLCSFLEVKYDLGIKTRDAYDKKDKKELLRLATEVYPEAVKRLKVFHESFEYLWHKENKSFGFEVHDARLGGVMQRLKTCAKQLERYATGKLKQVDQLEKPLLHEWDEDIINWNVYGGCLTYNSPDWPSWVL